MSKNSLNDLVVRLAEADRQERKWMVEEVEELRRVLACVIHQAGGSVQIPLRTKMYFKGTKFDFQVQNRGLVEEITVLEEGEIAVKGERVAANRVETIRTGGAVSIGSFGVFFDG